MIRRPFAHGDFGVYLHASRLLIAQENIYAIPTPPESGSLYYVYPPLLAFLFIPLTWISENAAIVLWCLFSVFLVWWIVRRSHEVLTGLPLSQVKPATRWIVGGLSVLFSARFILHHLDRGQANIAAMALLLLGMSVMHRRPAHAMLGGAL